MCMDTIVHFPPRWLLSKQTWMNTITSTTNINTAGLNNCQILAIDYHQHCHSQQLTQPWSPPLLTPALRTPHHTRIHSVHLHHLHYPQRQWDKHATTITISCKHGCAVWSWFPNHMILRSAQPRSILLKCLPTLPLVDKNLASEFSKRKLKESQIYVYVCVRACMDMCLCSCVCPPTTAW